jgi:hypothetical protein
MHWSDFNDHNRTMVLQTVLRHAHVLIPRAPRTRMLTIHTSNVLEELQVQKGKEHELDEEPVAPPPPPPRPTTGYKPPTPLATAPPTLTTTPLRPGAGGVGAASTRPGMPTMMPLRAGVPSAAPMAANARYAVSTAVPTVAAPMHPTGFAMPLARPSPARGSLRGSLFRIHIISWLHWSDCNDDKSTIVLQIVLVMTLFASLSCPMHSVDKRIHALERP